MPRDVGHRETFGLGHPTRLSNQRDNPRRVVRRAKRDEEHTFSEVVLSLDGRFRSKPRFSDPAGPDKGDRTDNSVAECAQKYLHHTLTTYERRGWNWDVPRGRRLPSRVEAWTEGFVRFPLPAGDRDEVVFLGTADFQGISEPFCCISVDGPA